MTAATKSPSSRQEVLERNALVDASDIAKEMNNPFNEEDIEQFDKMGISLRRAARGFCKVPAAVERNSFINNLHRQIVIEEKELTDRQVRAALNVMREHLLGLKPQRDPNHDMSLDPDLAGRFKCHECGHVSGHAVDHIEHRQLEHGYEPGKGTMDRALVEPESVLEVQVETGIDVMDLHDGFYAVPDERLNSGSKGGIRFLRVRRLKKGKNFRNRRYVYGRSVTGQEFVPVGTIEVRDITGDQRELIGSQRPDGKYQGKYEDLLLVILENQQGFSKLYAHLRQRCGICGKGLTDEYSRAVLIGPECEKKYPDYWTKTSTFYFRPKTEAEATALRTREDRQA